MIQFFQSSDKSVLAVETSHTFSKNDIEKLIWLFSGATPVEADVVKGRFVGPRREMITPWSTNAVEITQNMGLEGISRIEEYVPLSPEKGHDPMLQHVYDNLDQQLFTIDRKPDPIVYIDDIAAYNEQEGLALSADEVGYLNEVSKKLKRNLTDSEVFGFSQVNSEHCRHKIFGGTFIIDGEEKEHSLFALIKKTSAENPNKLVSAYKDNVAFNAGPTVEQFAPLSADKPDYFSIKKIDTVLSLKAETHNFPTTVEPFNGAATGTGGEIRDRLAGGVGYANKRDALKGDPKPKEKVVIIGGDNYRIGMGGGAVSSVDTGQYTSGIELNAVQRANPEMQKRAANVIRAIAESESNPIISIHDHGAGGHLNCLSELVEATGGHIDMSKLPVGDPTLSAKEIIGNESQERMGLLMKEKDVERVRRIAERERAPMYVVGQTTDDMKFVFEQQDGVRPIDIKLEYMFGKPPRTIMEDQTVDEAYSPVKYKEADLHRYLENVLQLEAVACKDWLTNKVDRSVTGKIARQQCLGELQLPLSDLGAVALDYRGQAGMATSIGHAPQVALIDPAAGSVMAIAEALTNIVFAPLADGLTSVSLSANWMWPCRNKGEDARLYKAVEAASDFACALGINIPTGKDSLSMTQKYGTDKVFSPGTVIISAAGEVSDIRKIVSPVLARDKHTYIYYIDFSFDALRLGGSAFAQSLGKVGSEAPTVRDFDYFRDAFNAVQEAIDKGLILAGHDISAGGMITALLEMCFANVEGGLEVDLNAIAEEDIVKILFAENPGVLVQVKEKSVFEKQMRAAGIGFARIARPTDERHLIVTKDDTTYHFGIDYMRDVWYKSSYLLDMRQSGNECAGNRYENYKMQPLEYKFHKDFVGTLASYKLTADRRKRSGVRAAILRDKGTNGEREMAYTLYLAGFDVKDVHLTDLASGRETLEDVNFIVFCGGFSNSDVLGSAKGWAAGILYNEKAKQAIDRFYARKDTMSLGICNGCQLMAELGLLYPEHEEKHKMRHNRSHKFESGFVGLDIPKNHSIMLGSLSGTKLGVWIAHGEGRFEFPYDEKQYHIVAKYSYDGYPANPNGSPWAVAGVCSADGRHLAMMPHPERSIFPWQCGYYPADRLGDDVTPWIEAFLNARRWIEAH